MIKEMSHFVYNLTRRYDIEEELEILKELNILISIKHNFFIPTLNLESKVKDEKSKKFTKPIQLKLLIGDLFNLNT
jgi:hypothetical protein